MQSPAGQTGLSPLVREGGIGGGRDGGREGGREGGRGYVMHYCSTLNNEFCPPNKK